MVSPLAKGLPIEGHLTFLKMAAVYFLDRPTGGEDKAHWANVFNAENCTKIAETLEAQANRIAELERERDEAVKLLTDMMPPVWEGRERGNVDGILIEHKRSLVREVRASLAALRAKEP